MSSATDCYISGERDAGLQYLFNESFGMRILKAPKTIPHGTFEVGIELPREWETGDDGNLHDIADWYLDDDGDMCADSDVAYDLLIDGITDEPHTYVRKDTEGFRLYAELSVVKITFENNALIVRNVFKVGDIFGIIATGTAGFEKIRFVFPDEWLPILDEKIYPGILDMPLYGAIIGTNLNPNLTYPINLSDFPNIEMETYGLNSANILGIIPNIPYGSYTVQMVLEDGRTLETVIAVRGKKRKGSGNTYLR